MPVLLRGIREGFLVRMRKRTARPELVDRVIAVLVNTCRSSTTTSTSRYSNGLKDIARCLGFEWTKRGPGLRSLAWRMRWEATGDPPLKEWLLSLQFGRMPGAHEGNGVHRSSSHRAQEPGAYRRGPRTSKVAKVHDLDRLANVRKWGPASSSSANSRSSLVSRFNYQRDHVYVRTAELRRRPPDFPPLPKQKLRPNRIASWSATEMPLLLGHGHRNPEQKAAEAAPC